MMSFYFSLNISAKTKKFKHTWGIFEIELRTFIELPYFHLLLDPDTKTCLFHFCKVTLFSDQGHMLLKIFTKRQLCTNNFSIFHEKKSESNFVALGCFLGSMAMCLKNT